MAEIQNVKLTGRTGANGAVVKVSKLGSGFSYWRVLVFAITFALGAVGTLLFQNVVGTEITTFSTLGLIGFVGAVALSSAATMLAVGAVTLGYVAQKEIRQRGEESYQLQNEISMRTIDTLLKIQSQTGIHAN